MDDPCCPACGLVLFRRGIGQILPRHCPRCIARGRRLVGGIPREQSPPAKEPSGAGQPGLEGPNASCGRDRRAGGDETRADRTDFRRSLAQQGRAGGRSAIPTVHRALELCLRHARTTLHAELACLLVELLPGTSAQPWAAGTKAPAPAG